METEQSETPATPETTVPKRSLYRQAAYIALPVILFFGLAETAARVRERYVPPMPVDIGQGFDSSSLLFTPSGDGFMETNPDKSASFQQQRFRLAKPPGTLRIFALGGSSVNYLDYEFGRMREALRQALANQYKEVEIINCGGLSYGSHRLVLIASEIVRYAPDIVLLYTGHNEFEELEQMHLAGRSDTPVQRILNHAALYRYVRDMRARQSIETLKSARAARNLAVSIPDASRMWLHEFSPEEIQERMKSYKTNLEIIIRLCRDNHIPVIIGTVPSNLFRPNLPGKDGARYEEVTALFKQGRYEEGVTLGRKILREASPRHQSSDLENEVIRELAREYTLPLADVESAITKAEPHGVPGETLFNDHCHLNPAGNEILRSLYQEKVLDILQH